MTAREEVTDDPARSDAKPEPLGERFRQALVYAAAVHAEQPRKGTRIPYVAHVMGVAALVLEDGGDEDQAIAALLHDAVEDQGGAPRLEDIRRRFGDRVARLVEGCTDSLAVDKGKWRERKEAYLRHLTHAPADVRRISMADKLYNARAILSDYRELGDGLWERFKGGKDGTLWYYRALVDAFREAGPSRLLDELDRVVSELERLAASAQEGR